MSLPGRRVGDAATLLVLATASIQTLLALGIIGFTFVTGRTAHYRVAQIVLALAFAGAALLLGGAARRDRRAVCLLTTFACVADSFARAALSEVQHDFAWLTVIFRGIYPEAFAPAALWRFAIEFPRVRRFTSFDVIARRAANAAWLLGVALFGVNLGVGYRLIDADHVLGRNHPGNLFWHLFALAVLPAVVAIFVRARRAPAAERRKVSAFALALAAGAAPFLCVAVTRMALPPVNRWFLSADRTHQVWIDMLIVCGLTAVPVLSTMAIVVDRAFEHRPFLLPRWSDRGVRTLLTAVAAAPFAAILVTLYQLRHLPVGSVMSGSQGWVLLAWALTGAALTVCRERLVALVESRGFRGAAAYQDRLRSALERVRLARGAREIGAVLCRELREGLGTTSVAIHVSVGLPSGVTAMLQSADGPIDLGDDGPLRALLPRVERDWVVSNRVELASPVKRRDGSVAAVVLIGQRRGSPRYDRRDRWLVATMVGGAAAAWDAGDADGSEDAALECERCGTVSDTAFVACCSGRAVVASLPPRLSGKFVVRRRLGAGGMGVVYLARDIALDRDVALKTLPEVREGAIGCLKDEARAMAALDHDGLATIYGLEVWRSTPVLVVEYFPDGTLASRLRTGLLAEPAAAMLGLRIADALDYMHGRGVLHRDLKPGNIGLTAAGMPKLLDFGLASLVTSGDDDGPGAACAGTPRYLPPEARRDARPGVAFDLWALAVVLLEAIGGRRPSELGDTDAAKPSGLVTASPELLAFFARALAPDPASRFTTARELGLALEAALRRPG